MQNPGTELSNCIYTVILCSFLHSILMLYNVILNVQTSKHISDIHQCISNHSQDPGLTSFFLESLHGKIMQLYTYLNLTREKKQVSHFPFRCLKFTLLGLCMTLLKEYMYLIGILALQCVFPTTSLFCPRNIYVLVIKIVGIY